MPRLRATAEWRFLGVLRRASPGLTTLWWGLVALQGLAPAAFALAMGWLISSVSRGAPLAWPLAAMGAAFVLMQVLSPIQDALSTNLGALTSMWLQDQMLASTLGAPGLAHLERPDLADQITLAREVERGMTGPDIPQSMPGIARGFSTYAAGLTSFVLLLGFRWWAAIVLAAAWLSTHWFLRAGALWTERLDPEVAEQQRRAGYAYRLSVDAPASKEMRLFGLADFVVGGMREVRLRLMDLSWRARRLGRRQAELAAGVVVVGNAVFFFILARATTGGDLSVGRLTVFAQAAIGVSALAFGENDWWFRTAAQPVPLVLDLAEKAAGVGALPDGGHAAAGLPASEIRFEGVSFAYPAGGHQVFEGLDLVIPAGRSLAIVGQNGAGKTTLAKLLCRLYDPTEGRVTVDGRDLRELDIRAWRQRVAAVFQDFIRYELPLRDNVAPGGATDEVVRTALDQARAGDLAKLDTILNRGYQDGTDLSGGQWQRVALARALASVQLGAGIVLLDEPTAQLDVRGETEIFEGLIEATRGCTTILISHRFSTVRRADLICVLEHGAVVELGSHDELMAAGGRYHTMFELQASRFDDDAANDSASDSAEVQA